MNVSRCMRTRSTAARVTWQSRYPWLAPNLVHLLTSLTFDANAGGLKGKKAQLAPACRDQGVVIFDPAGWTLDKGRLVVTARKGHQFHFDRQPDGVWLKDPKEGKPLSLRKM